MTYPQQPQWPAQAPPTMPPPPAPPAQFAPQYPVQPQGYYAQQMPQQYPPQGYQQPPPPPAAPVAKVGLDDFFQQPSVGTPSWSWKDKVLGHTYIGIVARELTAADFRHNTDMNNQPLYYRDGSPQVVMNVPMRVQSDAAFPNGEATWIVNARHRDELVRAMAEAGAPEGAPEAGAVIQVTLTERRPNRTGNPSNIVAVVYQRPQGAPVAVQQPTQAPAQQPTQAPAQQPGPIAQIPAQVAQQWAGVAQAAAQQPAPPASPQVAQPAAPPPGGMQMPEGLDPERQALWARMQGMQQPTG